MTVGFIGLGRMGAPIAANLVAGGYPLTVWNRDPAKAHAFAQRVPCDVAADPAALTAASDVVVTMVADGPALEDIFFSDPDVLAGLSGGVLIDMSTIGPLFACEFAERLAGEGVRFVESPVSGSIAAATSATLTLLIGADEADFAEVEPMLRVVGQQVRHLGPPGAASLVKLVINNVIYGINQAISEALVLAERGGLDRALVYDTVLASAAAAPMLGYRRDAYVSPGEGEVSFTLALAEKDLRLALEYGARLGVALPQAALNQQVALEAIAAGRGEQELSSVAEHLRQAAFGHEAGQA